MIRELQNSSSFDEVDDNIAATIAQEVAAQNATEDSEESEESDDEIDEVSAGESVPREEDKEHAEGMEGATDSRICRAMKRFGGFSAHQGYPGDLKWPLLPKEW